MADSTQDPLTSLAVAAVQLNELHRALVDAGFNDRQALYLTAAAMCGHPPDPQEGTDR
jgi:hypothetical protein